jgi:sugar (pentulose or hexulose) kinase
MTANETKNFVLGIDCSTSSCKAIVFDTQGNALSESRQPLEILHPQPEWHEQSAEEWWQAASRTISQAVTNVPINRLAALCITHQRETFVPVSATGNPLRNAVLWMDERAQSLLPQLEQLLDPIKFHQLTGKPLSGNLTLSKIAWLMTNEPEIPKKVSKYLDVHAFLVHRLTGEFNTGWGCADPTGLFDMIAKDWSVEILSSLGLKKDQFPQPHPPGTIIGTIKPAASQDCHLPVGLPVVAGVGDGQSAGLGANITLPGEAYLSLGTSVIGGVLSDRYVTSQAFRTMVAGIPNCFSLETVILGGTYTLRWLVQSFLTPLRKNEKRSFSGKQLEEAAALLPPGADGLILVPYWNSAMNPYWDASASGITIGWRCHHGAHHMYRAILEGIGYELRLHLSGVQQALGSPVKRLVASGGAARSQLWRQIIADITGIPVFHIQTPEAATLGAGILAATAVDLFPDVQQAAKAMVHLEPGFCQPDDSKYEYYTRLYEDVYVKIYPSLREPLKRLSTITHGS